MGEVGIRAERPEDAEAIQRLNDLAFGQPDEAELIAALRRSARFDPDLSLVFDIDGEIVGHILFSTGEIKAESGLVPVVILAPMCVDPGHREQGIGGRLVERGLEVCRDKGYTAVVLIGHSGYYPQFGFRRASEYGIESPFPVPDEAFMALELVDGAVRYVGGFGKYLKDPVATDEIRLRLGRSLSFALEFLVGADILRTLIAPSLTEISLLGATVAIRVTLNFFLEREADHLLSARKLKV